MAKKELYALVDCSTNQVCNINGKLAIFEYKGLHNPGNDPEQLLGKVLSSVYDGGMVQHKGCYRFIDYTKDCEDFYFDYKYFFSKSIICDSCVNCQKPTVEVIEKPLVYAKYTPPIMDSDQVTKNMCSFVQAVYQEMSQRKLGIKFCCQHETTDVIIDFLDTKTKLDSCIEYKPEIEISYPELESKTCVFTLTPEFDKGFSELFISIEKNEFPIVKSGAKYGEDVYLYLTETLNALGRGVWTYDYTNMRLSVTGMHEYADLIFTVGNTQTVYPESGMSFIFQPVCTLL